MLHDFVQVTSLYDRGTMQYRGTTVLKYQLEYPQFASRFFQSAVRHMNRYYRQMTLELKRYCRMVLYPQAVEQMRFSRQNGYEFFPYEADQECYLTLNKDCTASLYCDQYQFTGGAHGSTRRRSDTWNLKTGNRILLQDIMPYQNQKDRKQFLTDIIYQEIEMQNQKGDGTYFEDYEQKVQETFQASNFYLKPSGMVIYFQQYDIAPYSSGIPEFLIPYGKEVIRPTCRK